MTILDKVATSHNCKFWGVFFATLRKQLVENIDKSYHVYDVIVVLHIYHTIFGIRLIGYPANRNKRLTLVKF